MARSPNKKVKQQKRQADRAIGMRRNKPNGQTSNSQGNGEDSDTIQLKDNSRKEA